jgi:2,5-diamino-6-(ribosylamino)-4(3H)-pyrimidinone 5'-phosphate reductase
MRSWSGSAPSSDDPSLTVKSEECKQRRRDRGADVTPARIVIDSSARIPPGASVLHKGDGKRIVAVSARADPGRIAALKDHATVIVAGDHEVDLAQVMEELGAMGIRRVMVEGGGTLIAGLVAAGLVDEIYSFICNIIIGGKDAPTLADGPGFLLESEFCRLSLIEARRIEAGILLHWKVDRLPA